MGTWDVGPFDNDGAADWCGALDSAPPGGRVPLIRETLAAAADVGEDYLDSRLAEKAIAAAAIVASQLPDGPAVESAYAPSFVEGGDLEVPDDLPPLALRALDRIVGEDSEWRELWEESPDSYAKALAGLQPIRATLERAVG